MSGSRAVFNAGALYFLAALAAGIALGTPRVLWLQPLVGARAAELIEIPLMLVLMTGAAGWIVRRLSVPPAAGARLGMGAVGLALLLLVEFTLVLRLRGQTFAEYAASVDHVSAAAYYGSLVVFALLPVLRLRSRRALLL